MAVQVRRVAERERDLWQHSLEELQVEHHAYDWAWREVFAGVFGHQPYFLLAENNEGVTGILPLYHVKSFLFGSSLISVPYLNAGGVLSQDGASAHALVQHAVELAQELGVQYLELRHRAPLDESFQAADFPLSERSHKVSMLLDLSNEDAALDAELFFKSLPAKLRSQVRRPTKSGILAEAADGSVFDSRMLDGFYSVFSRHMRDLGTPVYPKRLFEQTLKAFRSRAQVIVAWLDSIPVACGLTIQQGAHSVEIPWASSLRRFNRESPNMLVYWHAIKTAHERGCHYFDFGRSTPDSGPFRFKKQWGAEPLPLYWYYWAKRDDKIPDINPKASSFTPLVTCWKQLPLPLANTLGPWITRSLP